MRFVVLGGAGHIGSGVVRLLLKLSPEAEVIIADQNLEKARKLSSELGGRTLALEVRAEERDSLGEAMKGAEVVVNTIGPYYVHGPRILKAAIEAGVNYVDVDDDHDATSQCLELDEKARMAGVVAVIGLGATPGLLNLLAKRGAERMGEVREIHTAWAWTAVDPDMGPAIVSHYFHAISGEVPTYRDGKWVRMKALSEPEIVEFPPPLGRMEVYHVGHPEPVTLPRYLKGVRTVTNKGTVWPKLLADLSRTFAEMGLTGMKELRIKGIPLTPREILVALILQLEEIAPPELLETAMAGLERLGEYSLGVGLKVRMEGKKDGKPVRYSYGAICRSAVMATALPAALGAVMMARGELRGKGVFPPEGIIEPSGFLKRVAREVEIFEAEESTSTGTTYGNRD